MNRRRRTMLPPPPATPVEVPDMPTEPLSDSWRAVLETSRDTVRPGRATTTQVVDGASA